MRFDLSLCERGRDQTVNCVDNCGDIILAKGLRFGALMLGAGVVQAGLAENAQRLRVVWNAVWKGRANVTH